MTHATRFNGSGFAYTGATAKAGGPYPEQHMKGMDQKKQKKKEPTKTLKEKRAAKQEKKKSS